MSTSKLEGENGQPLDGCIRFLEMKKMSDAVLTYDILIRVLIEYVE